MNSKDEITFVIRDFDPDAVGNAIKDAIDHAIDSCGFVYADVTELSYDHYRHPYLSDDEQRLAPSIRVTVASRD